MILFDGTCNPDYKEYATELIRDEAYRYLGQALGDEQAKVDEYKAYLEARGWRVTRFGRI
jgi:hypothetical protein